MAMARLASGELVVAMGELGLAWFDAQGRKIDHLHTPVTDLVLADHGQRFLALYRLDEQLVEVKRVEATSRQWSAWIVAKLTGWADTYDGQRWLVMTAEQVLALEVNLPGAQTPWRSGDLGAPPLALARDRGRLSVLTRAASGQLQSVLYALPSMPLMDRITWPKGVHGLLRLLPEGQLVVQSPEGIWILAPNEPPHPSPFGALPGALCAIATNRRWIAAVFARGTRQVLEVGELGADSPRASLTLGLWREDAPILLSLRQDTLMAAYEDAQLTILSLERSGAPPQQVHVCDDEALA